MDLTSLNNEKVKYWQKLKEKKYRDSERLFLVEDMHLVNEAIKKGILKEIITTNKDIEYDIPTYYVTEAIMKSISSQVTSAKVIGVCNMLKDSKINGKIICLDRIQDPGNLGTIIRSAVAFNFDSIILSDDSVDLYNPKVVRSSEGMIFNINIIRCNLKDFLNKLDDNYKIVTTSVNEGKDIKEIEYKNIAIIIGNEGMGVSSEINELADEKVYIKMNKNCESLNAGVTASILMYEVCNG